MNKSEFINEVREKLANISSDLEYLSNVNTTDISIDDMDGVVEVQDELDELEDQINQTIYNSEEFHDLQKQIEEKEKELEKAKEKAQEEIDEVESVIDDLNSEAHDFFDVQFGIYTKLGEEL